MTDDNISTSNDVSEEERLKYLQELQEKTTITMLPAIIFLIILGLTGLIGNSLVLVVYSQKYKWTSTKVFIMVIAGFDIIANVLAIPGEIYDMFHTWDFDSPTLCKARLFVTAYITIGSGLILVAIAVTRYRKICTPFSWQIDVKEAKIICLVVVILTGLISSPYVVVFGRQTKNTTHPNITGYECTTDDSYVNTVWPTVVYGLFLIVFIGCCIPLFVLYIRIGIKAWKHNQMFGDSQHSTLTLRSNSVSTERNDHFPASARPSVASTMTCLPASRRGTREDLKDTKGIQILPESSSKKEKLHCENSCSSVDFGSLADIMEEYQDHIETPESAEDYTVNIGSDRVEIRTPMMGEFVVPLLNNENSDCVTATQPLCHADDMAASSHSPVKTTNINDDDHGNTDKLHPGASKTTYTNEAFLHDDIMEEMSSSQTDIQQKVLPNQFKISVDTQRHFEVNVRDSKLESGQTERELDDTDSTEIPSLSDHNSAHVPSASTIQERPQIPFQPVQNLSEHELSKTPTCQDHHTSVLKTVAISSEDLQKVENGEVSRSVAPEGSSELKESSPQRQARQIRKPSVTIQEDAGEKHNTRNDDSDKPRPSISLSTALMNTFRRISNMSSMSDSPKRRLRKRPLGKTTAMLLIISAVFAFSFMPHLAAMFFENLAPEKYEAMTRAGASTYNVFLRFYFLNCAANPIIYSLCDVKFRRECVSLFRCSSCNK